MWRSAVVAAALLMLPACGSCAGGDSAEKSSEQESELSPAASAAGEVPANMGDGGARAQFFRPFNPDSVRSAHVSPPGR